jgi:hypothetical protein
MVAVGARAAAGEAQGVAGALREVVSEVVGEAVVGVYEGGGWDASSDQLSSVKQVGPVVCNCGRQEETAEHGLGAGCPCANARVRFGPVGNSFVHGGRASVPVGGYSCMRRV